MSGVDPWRTLEALSFYRAAVCVALLTLAASAYRPPYFIGPNAPLIDACLFGYLFLAALLLVLVRGQRPSPAWQAAIQIGLDIVVIIILDYASGGIASGLSTLLVTPIAAGSLLLDRRMTALPPAIATIALLLVEIFLNLEQDAHPQQYTQAGILGAGLFVIAFSGNALARRARESETRARLAQNNLAKLAALSESVIQKLQAGVVVMDASGHIELMNRAARKLLGNQATPGSHLASCAAPLWQKLTLWRADPAALSNSALSFASNQPAWAQFTRLGAGNSASTLIVLDDASRVAEQAQSMKLASLGRLTASIAHELRNPLAAIQHAAELAGESQQISDDDRPLIDIIQRQSRRLGEVINSILNLSRKSNGQADPVELAPLLQECLDEFLQASTLRPVIHCEVRPESCRIFIEPIQFIQVMHNLLENACIHGRVDTHPLEISIHARPSADGSQVLIDLRDNGPGISAEVAAHVFEPFFSTHTQGTGLGLFITRELCSAANGDLSLVRDDTLEQGAYFRLSFPAASKQT